MADLCKLTQYVESFVDVSRTPSQQDRWCAAQPLASLYHDIYLISSKKNALVAHYWVDSNQAWDLGLRRRVFDREIGNYIALAQLLTGWVVNRARDSLRSKLEASGQFSTKSTFLKLTKRATKVNLPVVNLIWKPKIPWSLAYRSLNAQEKLQRRFPNWSLYPSVCPPDQKVE
ncbi:Transposon TX1 uncharacterized [Cucumis melo var. makuwa]|uniref:Transposon TX1 uncharacterized n=1 Tax=Cucumis melo var. makuwa TaxID=1194695 RepID=A0A5D3BWG7_CUCMM|nr:Transposon TX1 uncharacterized [Cucumis melo var. makuwa]TYK03847.1 Transposon TX1 uncharacterized [Cucumis melo var. makuwa]